MRPPAKWFSYAIIFVFFVAMLPTSTAFAADLDLPFVSENQSGVASATANNIANVRSGPGAGFWIVGVLQARETVPVTGVSADGGWWRISTSFTQGWVATSVVTVSNASTVAIVDPGPIVSVTIGELNVRSGPGELAPLLGRVTFGNQLFLIGRSADGRWLNVRSQFGSSSWIAAEFTSAGVLAGGGPDTNTEAVPDTGVVPVTSSAAFVIVNAPFLNVRSGPSVEFTIVGVVEGGDQLPIIGTNASRTWFNVETSFGEGWVSDLFVVARNEFGGSAITTDTVDPTSIIRPVAIVNADSLNVRSGPSADFTIVGVVRGGETFDLLARTIDFSWILVDGETFDGWINRRFVIIRGDTTRLAVANATNAATITNPTTGETIEVAPEISGPVAFVATGALNIRTGPNVAFETLGFVYAATRMPIIGQSADGGWWLVESPFGNGWVNKRLVIVENNALNVPVVQ